MTYKCLTNADLTIEEEPIMTVNGKPFYGKKASSFERTFYESGLMHRDYHEVLEAAGIETKYANPDHYDIGSMDANTVLALLTAIVRSERFGDGKIAACIESGLVVALLNRLEAIDAVD